MEYQQTGNSIPISVDLLMDHVFYELDRYDGIINASGAIPDVSPYTSPLIYTTEEGKQVKIPDNVQMNAIELWNRQKKTQLNPQSDYEKYKEAFSELHESPSNLLTNKVIQQVQPIENDQPIYVVEKKDNKLYWIILIVILCAAGYYYYKRKN